MHGALGKCKRELGSQQAQPSGWLETFRGHFTHHAPHIQKMRGLGAFHSHVRNIRGIGYVNLRDTLLVRDKPNRYPAL